MFEPQPTAPDLPDGSGFPAAMLAQAMDVVAISPTVEGNLAYRLVLPRGWTVLDRPLPSVTEIGALRPVVLGLHMGPIVAGGPPFVQVMAMALEREIAAADWLRQYAAASGYDIRTLGELHSGRADALISLTIRDDRYAARLLVNILGGRLVALLAAVPGEHYEELADLLGLVTASFVMPDEDPDIMVEGLRPMAVAGSTRVLLPASWQVVSATNDGAKGLAGGLVGGLGVHWADAQGIPQGVLHIYAGASMPTEMERLRTILGPSLRQGALLADRLPALEDGPFTGGYHKIYSVTETTPDAPPRELWHLRLDGAGSAVDLMLLTPARDHSFSAWAINRRALDIVLQTIEVF
jgi:hypothetical protein